MDPLARTLVELGSVLPGGLSEWVATTIGGFDGDAARRALRQLAWLHLVDAFPGTASLRYRSLDPIRTALVDGLGRAAREEAITRSTHAVQGLVDRLWPDHTAPVVLSALDAVADEHDNLRFLLADRITNSPTSALDLAIGASEYWALRGHMVEGRAWLRDAMQAARPEGPSRWRAALALVRATRTMAETAQLRDLLESVCTEATGDTEHRTILGGILLYLAIARGWQGDRVGAAHALEKAGRIDDEIGSEWSRANLEHLRAFDRALGGDFEGARLDQLTFADRMIELDDLASAATGRYLAAALGDMMGSADVLPAVRRDLAAARELAEHIGDVSLLSQILLLEARVLQRSNDAGSRAVLVDAAARLVQHGGVRAAALARRDIGLLALGAGEYDEAAEHLRFVAPILLRLDRSASAPAWAGLAVIHLERGDLDGAAWFATAARSRAHPDAPHWVDDERRVATILADFDTSVRTEPVGDEELLDHLGVWEPE